MRTLPLTSLVIGTMPACGCAGPAKLAETDPIGPSPTLAPPQHRPIPDVNVVEAIGWADEATPMPAEGLRVTAFARGLDHPRWLHVLPNGDVLVAETNAPPRPDDTKGLRGWL